MFPLFEAANIYESLSCKSIVRYFFRIWLLKPLILKHAYSLGACLWLPICYMWKTNSVYEMKGIIFLNIKSTNSPRRCRQYVGDLIFSKVITQLIMGSMALHSMGTRSMEGICDCMEKVEIIWKSKLDTLLTFIPFYL